MFEVNIYLETSMKGPGTRKGWYAAVVEYQSKKHGIQTREFFSEMVETTYNKSALLSALEALKILNAECILKIHTDSVYMVSSFNNGNLERWKKNGFLNVKGENIKNQSEWQQLSEQLEKHQYEFVYAKHHSYTKWMMEEAQKRMSKAAFHLGNTECEGDFENEH